MLGRIVFAAKREADETEYGQPYCRFGFPLNFESTSKIDFTELEGGCVPSMIPGQLLSHEHD